MRRPPPPTGRRPGPAGGPLARSGPIRRPAPPAPAQPPVTPVTPEQDSDFGSVPGDLATPVPQGGGSQDESMIFMTHMPGTTVPPRPAPLVEQDQSLKKLSDDLAEKERIKAGGEPAPKPKTGRGRGLTGRLMEGAGRGALERTLEAGRKSGGSGGISQMFLRAETRSVAGVTRPKTPDFFPQLPGALLQPLRGDSLGAVLGGAAMLAVAGVLFELSPLVGFLALTVVLLELSALRLRSVRELAHGHDALSWPDVGEVLAAVPTAIVLLALCLGPALAVGSLALPEGAWDEAQPAGLRSRLERVWRPAPAPPPAGALPGESAPEPLGRQALLRLEAVLGTPPAAPDPRTPPEVARDLRDRGLDHVRALLLPADPTPAGRGARALLLLGLLVFPMALLAAAVLRSAYAAAHLPLLLRGVMRAPMSYLVVAGAFAVADLALLLLLILPGPALQGALGPVPGHLLSVLAFSLAASVMLVVTSALLGRFYRAFAFELGWE